MDPSSDGAMVPYLPGGSIGSSRGNGGDPVTNCVTNGRNGCLRMREGANV
jgi:hypothetical protein